MTARRRNRRAAWWARRAPIAAVCLAIAAACLAVVAAAYFLPVSDGPNRTDRTPEATTGDVPAQAAHEAPRVVAAGATAAVGHAEEEVKSFLGAYCTRCHGPAVQKGERRFDRLNLALRDEDTLIDLQAILDQLNLGTMPPANARQPGDGESREAIERLTRIVVTARAAQASTGGQTVLRRLNRREYRNTVGDLFALNMTIFDPTTRFPRDQTVEHRDNIGDALVTSGHLLEQYLDAADQVVEKAFSVQEPPRSQTWVFNSGFKQQPELDYPHRTVYGYRYLCLYESNRSVRHEGAYGPLLAFSQGVPTDGFYEIRVKAEAVHRRHPYDPKIFGMDPDAPFRLGIIPGNARFGPLHHPQPIEPLLAETTLTDEGPEWYTFRVWLDAGFTPRFTFPNGMIDGRRGFTLIFNRYRNLLPEDQRRIRGIYNIRGVVLRHGKMPHVRIHEVAIRGPLSEEWPPASHRAILGDQPFEPARTRQILERLASRAYRRPARDEEIDQLAAVVARRRADGKSPFEALKDGLKAALCSPAFLYLEEPELADGERTAGKRRLSAYALAARLSYFLWSTMPDAELTRLAGSGELLQPEVLVAQVRRMLADARSNEFVEGFTDSWLNLRRLGDMPPDRDAFERYYADDLQNAMLRETRLFTRHLIDDNESIVRFLDADYTFVNKPLADLYGLSGSVSSADGHVFRRVQLNNPNRGGLLGQGSVLTVTANGIETSPVTRGVWLLSNILGTPPAPPPDDVPPLDPDVRGATSVRDLLTKHRQNRACFDCHQKIDPLGFALENFDPIGAWRGHYGNSVAIDASGQLPGGIAFKNIGGLKQILVERKEQFARALARKLLAYAIGRRIDPLDRPQVDAIVHEFRKRGYGFRDLIELVVLSDAFQSK